MNIKAFDYPILRPHFFDPEFSFLFYLKEAIFEKVYAETPHVFLTAFSLGGDFHIALSTSRGFLIAVEDYGSFLMEAVLALVIRVFFYRSPSSILFY